MRSRVLLSISVFLLLAGVIAACNINTYSDDSYSVVKKLFQKNETVYLKGTGIGASPQCFADSAAKVEYYAPGQCTPTYTHICTSSTCYLPNNASGTVRDQLPLNHSDIPGMWTAKVYRGKYSHYTGSCYWDYRMQTSFNVSSFGYACSISLTHPENGSVFTSYEPVIGTGQVSCEGDYLNPLDYYAEIQWEDNQTSPALNLSGPMGGPWQFTSDPYNNYYYYSGTQYILARLYKRCVPLQVGGTCDYIVATSEIVEIHVNIPPIADPGENQEVTLGQTVHFDGSGSYDIDGSIAGYSWDFGDGENGTGVQPAHAYSSVGFFTVALTVTDDLGAQDANSVYITVGSPEAEYITISPENTTTTVGSTVEYSATAHDSYNNSWDVTAGTEFSSGAGTFEGNVLTAGPSPGTYVVAGNHGGLTANAEITLINAEAERIEVTPENEVVEATGQVTYHATAYDNYNNPWDVTGDTTFASDAGSFENNVLTAGTMAGAYELFGNYGPLSDATMVTVTHGEAIYIYVSPDSATLPPMGTQEYTATAVDEYGNEWDVTDETNFSSEGGTFNGSTFTAGTSAGEYAVHAYYGDLYGNATVTITPGEPVEFVITPRNLTLSVGSAYVYAATFYDAYGNPTDVTGDTVFSSDGGDFNGSTFTAGTEAGTYTVYGNYGDFSDSTPVNLVNSEAVRMTITPRDSEMAAGDSKDYHATAYDNYNNSWDVTYATDFGSEAGSFGNNTLTSNGMTGTFEVSGEYGEFSDYTHVTVTHGEPAELLISPDSATVNVGGTVEYHSIAYDAYGNEWDVTGETDFDVSGGGTFSSNTFTATTPGTYTVTGTYGSLVDYANVNVNEGGDGPSGPTGPGAQGGSSLGFNYTLPKPPVPTCSALGSACEVTTDCCEGACISGVCEIPEEKPVEKKLVELVAPDEAYVDDVVELLLRYVEDGQPVEGASIQVITPSYEITVLLTGDDGKTSYVPKEEGWHDYLVPGYDVGGVVSTYVHANVTDAGRVNIIRYGPYKEREFSSATGFFLFNLAPELLGLLMLILLLLSYGAYLYYKEQQEPDIDIGMEPIAPMRKIRGRKPKKPAGPRAG